MRKEERRRKTPPEKPTPTAANDAEKLKKYSGRNFCRQDTFHSGLHDAFRSSNADGIPSGAALAAADRIFPGAAHAYANGDTFRSRKGSSRKDTSKISTSLYMWDTPAFSSSTDSDR
jgi:hypothetical protein